MQIGADICEKKDRHGRHVLDDVQDKVVQDVDGSEGTGIWSNTQAIDLHVPAPTLTVAHYFRLASADRQQRAHERSVFHGSFEPSKIDLDVKQKDFLEDLRMAVYTSCLAAYVQGMNIISVADREHHWNISYSTVIQIWRAGCIIRSDHIASLLEAIFSSTHKDHNLLYEAKIASELKNGFKSLKNVVIKATECNAVIPSLSATLEYLKYSCNLDLPTSFYEAELDYFGKHMYDSRSKDEDPGSAETGKRHFEWKPA